MTWLKAIYEFHTFAYRDPRAPSSWAVGLPVVSPTTVLLGIASTLFSFGRHENAREFLSLAHVCRVAVDSPEAAVFFRAFQQLRRYETDKHDKNNARVGLTSINQANREYALTQGPITIYVGIPAPLVEPVTFSLRNRDHLGTHDSLCSLSGDVEVCSGPNGVTYLGPEATDFPLSGATVVTLSRFKSMPLEATCGDYWWMAGGPNTELVPYVIKGTFKGTSRGKVYVKEG